MTENRKIIVFHILTALIVSVWGTTFASTKLLLDAGIGAVEIMLYRFIIAYICMLIVSHKKLFCNNWKDELVHFFCGVTGGSLFFIAENSALNYTTTTNVAILICTTPLFTALLAFLFDKERLERKMLLGSAVAMVGVVMVVLNGRFELEVNPYGDVLTLFAAFLWGIYSLLLRRLSKRYSSLFITRKVFLYGILSLGFYVLFFPLNLRPELLPQPVVWGNLLYLGVIASMVCFWVWSASMTVLGPAKASNYMYVQPFVALVTGYFFLSEPVTLISILGAVLIIGGVYLAER